ncbi:MAG: hypothetical protein EOP11_09295 [Proteobacteria bacterium]|nr:MAG: hypothetical protein EOP11_09295 [Pseudomonadota bacterium]
MSWLDLGWLKTSDGWEFHPWGPFNRAYLLSDGEAAAFRRRVRTVRGLVLLGVIAAVALSLWAKAWLPLVGFALVGTALEAIGMWVLVKSLPRSEKALGFDAGIVYLARWFGPKLTRVAKVLTILLLALAAYLLWLAPQIIESYLLLGLFVGLLYVLHYLEAVQQTKE